MALLGVDLSGLKEQEGFSVLPPGEYDVQVEDSKEDLGPKGRYIQMTFQVIGHPGKVWETFSVNSEFAMSRMKTLAKCAGHPNPSGMRDTAELHGKMVRVKLKIEHDETGKYDDKNRISAFLAPKNGAVGATPCAPIAPAAPAQAPKMPWEK